MSKIINLNNIISILYNNNLLNQFIYLTFNYSIETDFIVNVKYYPNSISIYIYDHIKSNRLNIYNFINKPNDKIIDIIKEKNNIIINNIYLKSINYKSSELSNLEKFTSIFKTNSIDTLNNLLNYLPKEIKRIIIKNIIL